MPRTTREVGAWIEKEWGIEYQGRSGLIALPTTYPGKRVIHRLYRDQVIARPIGRSQTCLS